MTRLTLSADDAAWRAESVQPSITMCFRHHHRIHISALSFNGESVFDHRLPKGWSPSAHLKSLDEPLPEIPVLKPITIRPVEFTCPEFNKGGAA